jgi:hypothetical protein
MSSSGRLRLFEFTLFSSKSEAERYKFASHTIEYLAIIHYFICRPSLPLISLGVIRAVLSFLAHAVMDL